MSRRRDRVVDVETVTLEQSLREARVHLDAAERWFRYGITGTVPVDVAARLCTLNRLRAIGWLVGAPPFTTAA